MAGIVKSAVLYNETLDQYVKLDLQTTGGDPSQLQWTMVTDANLATRWINTNELQYFLTDTPLGDPNVLPYPWEIRIMYFSV